MPSVNLRPYGTILLAAIAGCSVSAIAVAVAYPLAPSLYLPPAIAKFRTPHTTPQALRQGDGGERLIFVDVRSPAEYAADHIAGSVLIPLTDIEADIGLKHLAELAKANPGATLVLYCQTGPRSVRAYQRLQAVGWDDTGNYVVLRGGIEAWRVLEPVPNPQRTES